MRYGITIKDPSFDGISYSTYNNVEIIKKLTTETAKLCAAVLNSKKEMNFTNEFIVIYIKELLVCKVLNGYKNSVENGELYLDIRRETKWCYEDSVERWENTINAAMTMLYTYMLTDISVTFPDTEPKNLVSDVYYRMKEELDDLEEILDGYVVAKLALINVDKVIEEPDEYEDLRNEINQTNSEDTDSETTSSGDS